MKNGLLILLVLGLKLSLLSAQKEAPSWAAGIYGHISFGYSGFKRPFRDAAFTSPSSSFTGSGWNSNWGCGVTFRKRWGLLAEGNFYTSNQLRNPVESLEAANPGYTADYLNSDAFISAAANEIVVGLSYVFPHKRWAFRPELLVGSTELYTDWSRAIQLKETGTNTAYVIRFSPIEYTSRSPTLKFGGRAIWYAGSYWGLFTEARGITNWYKLQYRIRKTDLLEQSVAEEEVRLKDTVFGVTGGIGIFLQVGRWEKPVSAPR